MHDQPAGQMVRCSKTRAMLASRACRKSIMIGMPLTIQQMTSVRTDENDVKFPPLILGKYRSCSIWELWTNRGTVPMADQPCATFLTLWVWDGFEESLRGRLTNA